MNNRIDRWLIIVVLMVSLLTLWSNQTQLGQIKDMSNELDNYRNQIEHLYSELRILRNDMAEDMAEDDLIQSFSFDYVASDNNEVTIQTEVIFNIIEEGALVTIQYKPVYSREKGDLVLQVPDPSDEWVSVEAYTEDGLSYMTNFTVKNYYLYELRVKVESNGVLQGAQLGLANPVYKFYPQLYGNIHTIPYSNDGEIMYLVSLEVFSEEDIGIDEVLCEVMYKDEVIESFDLLTIENTSYQYDEMLTSYEAERKVDYELGPDQQISDNDLSYRMRVKLSTGMEYAGVWDDLPN